VVGIAGLLLLGGCGPGGEEAVAEFPSSSARELAPSGAVVVGYPPAPADPELQERTMPWGQIVADGAGQVWLTTSWGVTRVDPASGESTTWDAADDEAFASISALAPTSGTGVWLLGGDRVRLFDGQRFTVDLQVPSNIFTSGGAPGTVGHVHDLAEAGSEFSLGLHDVAFPGDAPGRSVAQWSGGAWTVLAQTSDGIGGYLEADVDDRLWAGGWLASEGPSDGSGLSRWDGTGWSLPGAGSDQVQGRKGDVVADPTGGVWLLSTVSEEGPPGLYRFDGTAWSPMDAGAVSSALGDEGWGLLPGLSVEPAGEWGPGTVAEGAETGESRGAWLAVSAAGDAWLAGPGGVARFSPDGSTQAFGLDAGFSVPIRGVAAPGRDVVVMDYQGLLRWEGDRFSRLWQDPVPDTVFAESVVGVTSDEVWVSGAPSESAASNLYRHGGGAWETIGPAQSCDVANYPAEGLGSGPAAVAATDGAIWAGTTQGLARTVGEDTQVVTSSRLCPQFAGPGGAVWARAGDDIVLVGPDGRKEPIQLPDDRAMCRWAAGVAPAVWISSPVRPPVKDLDDGQSDEPCDAVPSVLNRWDGGAWAEIASPEPDVPVVAIAVTDDGAAWALSYSDGVGSIARYADGRWTTLTTGTPYPLKFSAARGGRVCTLESNRTFYFGDRLTCFDSSGEVAHFDLEGMWDFSIAPDGAVWVTGPEVARIAEALPGG
jgi:hypothetical protein